MPIARLVIGKPVGDVAALVPRIFNLCKTAQSVATRMALGLPVEPQDHTALFDEIRREHQLRLQVLLPAQLGLAAQEAPVLNGDMTLEDVFALPNINLISMVREYFAPGEAVSLGVGDENSVAGRQRQKPLMRAVETTYGRGPLWRILARYLELNTLDFALPRMCGRWAIVPAARGRYSVRAAVIDGCVTQFERITPTDDMLADGGIIDTSLATLPRKKKELAQLVLDIIDPCVPLGLREVYDA